MVRYLSVEQNSRDILKEIVHGPLSSVPDSNLFYFEHVVNSWYYIRSKLSGLYINAHQSSSSDSIHVLQMTNNQGDAALWRFETPNPVPEPTPKPDPTPSPIVDPLIPINRDVFIWSQHSGKVLDIFGGSFDNLAELIIYPFHGNNNQRFVLEPYGGYYVIRAVHSGKVLDIEGGSTGALARVIQYNAHYGNNQLFEINRVNGEWFSIKARHSGLVFDVYGGSTQDRTKLIQYPYHGNGNQLFKFQVATPTNKEVLISNKQNVKAITLAGINIRDLFLKNQNSDYNQRFMIEFRGDRTYSIRSTLSNKFF